MTRASVHVPQLCSSHSSDSPHTGVAPITCNGGLGSELGLGDHLTSPPSSTVGSECWKGGACARPPITIRRLSSSEHRAAVAILEAGVRPTVHLEEPTEPYIVVGYTLQWPTWHRQQQASTHVLDTIMRRLPAAQSDGERRRSLFTDIVTPWHPPCHPQYKAKHQEE